jgi:hypothetical protein
MGTRNGQWYTVKCSGNGVVGDRVELRTTQNTYLSISGIELWTGEPALTSTTVTTTSTMSGGTPAGKSSKISL